MMGVEPTLAEHGPGNGHRHLYGIQPKPNRLYIEPRLPASLGGTRLHHEWRGQTYEIELSPETCAITAGHSPIRAPHPFAVTATATGMQYFRGKESDSTLSVSPPAGAPLTVILPHRADAPGANREWIECTPKSGRSIPHCFKGLRPNITYRLSVDGRLTGGFRADQEGRVEFSWKPVSIGDHQLQLSPAP